MHTGLQQAQRDFERCVAAGAAHGTHGRQAHAEEYVSFPVFTGASFEEALQDRDVYRVGAGSKTLAKVRGARHALILARPTLAAGLVAS